jgi:hypothetical protein
VSAPGATLRETSGPETMCSATEAVRVPTTPAALPLKRSVTSPGEAAAATATVTVCEEPGRMPKVAGDTVTPAGGEAVTLIVPANPLRPVAVTDKVPAEPGASVREAGVAPIAKSGRGVISSVKDAVRDPLTPAAVPENEAPTVPVAAAAATATETTWDVPGVSANAAGVNVTLGIDGAVTLTDPEKPPEPEADTVTLPEAPAATWRRAGEIASEKSDVGEMTIVSPADRLPVMPEAVPVKDAARLPGDAAADAETVTVCEKPGVRLNEAGVNVRFGTLGAVTAIDPEKPFRPVAWTVVVPEPPGRSMRVAGEAEREKSGAAVTVTVTGTLCVSPAEGTKLTVSG